MVIMKKVFCPLEDFKFDRSVEKNFQTIEISEKIKIVSNSNIPDLSSLNHVLSKNDIEKYKYINYWLEIEDNQDLNNSETIMILFQLALLITIPTKISIPFMTDFKGYSNPIRYILNPLKGYTERKLNEELILEIKEYYKLIQNEVYSSKRLNSAMLFTFDSCISKNWDAAYILFVTAFECLLNHKTHICKTLREKLEWGLTKKLSWAYAIVTETENENRQIAFEDFRDIYKIRSEILHGGSYEDKHKNEKYNRERLANCRDMLRKFWKVILESPKIIEKLSGDDKVRRKYFKKVANGWMPEDKYERKE